MIKRVQRIAMVMFLSLAPIAGLAATPNDASACKLCVQYYQPFEHKQCDTVAVGGYTFCQVGPDINRCTQSGACL